MQKILSSYKAATYLKKPLVVDTPFSNETCKIVTSIEELGYVFHVPGYLSLLTRNPQPATRNPNRSFKTEYMRRLVECGDSQLLNFTMYFCRLPFAI
jgi:hypothetical protein